MSAHIFVLVQCGKQTLVFLAFKVAQWQARFHIDKEVVGSMLSLANFSHVPNSLNSKLFDCSALVQKDK